MSLKKCALPVGPAMLLLFAGLLARTADSASQADSGGADLFTSVLSDFDSKVPARSLVEKLLNEPPDGASDFLYRGMLRQALAAAIQVDATAKNAKASRPRQARQGDLERVWP